MIGTSPKSLLTPLLTPLIFASLVACGGSGSNPITGGPTTTTDDTTIDQTDPNTTASEKFAFDVEKSLVANSVEFDDKGTASTDDDELVINNIPFDTETGVYERTRTLANGWGLYQNAERGTGTRLNYYAVFNRSDSGHTEGGAIASPDWTGARGNAGLVVRRDSTAVSLPVEGIVKYTGTYSGTREIDNDKADRPGLEIVTGDARVLLDFDDFDITGDIVGFINNRKIYDADTGEQLGTLGTVSLAEGRIDRSDSTIKSSTARSLDGSLEGTWEGVFGGANGEEIAAYVVLEGENDTSEDGVDVRELGVLLVKQ